MTNKVYAGMATVPEREEYLEEILSNIAPQVDQLWLPIDKATQHKGPRQTFDNVRGLVMPMREDDARKFAPLWSVLHEDFYYFSLDDDLIYPENYVEKMIYYLDLWNNEVIACVHGSWLPHLPIDSYYQDKKAVHFAQDLTHLVQVLFPGTGTTAFHTSTIRPAEGDFPIPNIADVQFGIAAQQAGVPVISFPRGPKWIKQHPDINALEGSIWAERKDDDDVETELINSYESQVGWAYPELPVPEEGSQPRPSS